MTFLSDRVYDVRTADEKAAKKVPIDFTLGILKKFKSQPTFSHTHHSKGPDTPASLPLSLPQRIYIIKQPISNGLKSS